MTLSAAPAHACIAPFGARCAVRGTNLNNNASLPQAGD